MNDALDQLNQNIDLRELKDMDLNTESDDK